MFSIFFQEEDFKISSPAQTTLVEQASASLANAVTAALSPLGNFPICSCAANLLLMKIFAPQTMSLMHLLYFHFYPLFTSARFIQTLYFMFIHFDGLSTHHDQDDRSGQSSTTSNVGNDPETLAAVDDLPANVPTENHSGFLLIF